MGECAVIQSVTGVVYSPTAFFLVGGGVGLVGVVRLMMWRQ